MAQYIAHGEFGTETVEADTLHDAARQVAKAHARPGVDEPWWFTVAPAETPDNTREFQAEWSPEDGLAVYDYSSGELL